MTSRRIGSLAAAAAAVGLAATFASAPAASAKDVPADYQVVASGLDNPRHLSLGRDGAIWVAEAGHAGPTCSGKGQERLCVGLTGRISSIRGTKATVRYSGLPSGGGDPSGVFATGLDGVSVAANGRVYAVTTGGPPESTPAKLRALTARLWVNVGSKGMRTIADLGAYERRHDPDKQGPDTNPYDVLALRNGNVLVADAAANDILLVHPSGRITTFAVLANVQTGACKGKKNDKGTTGCDFVPTALAVGRDGHILVSGLAGETPGAGQVREIDFAGRVVKTWTGFTGTDGVGWASDGSLWVSELLAGAPSDPNAQPDFPNVGQVTRVLASGERQTYGVPTPGGILVRSPDRVYVTSWSVAPAGGAFGNKAWSGRLVRVLARS